LDRLGGLKSAETTFGHLSIRTPPCCPHPRACYDARAQARPRRCPLLLQLPRLKPQIRHGSRAKEDKFARAKGGATKGRVKAQERTKTKRNLRDAEEEA
jgi:hypothetical protein